MKAINNYIKLVIGTVAFLVGTLIIIIGMACIGFSYWVSK